MRPGAGTAAIALTAPARIGAVRHGLAHLSRLIAALTASPADSPGNWLYRRDPRAKVCACLALAVTATLLSSLAALVWCAGLSFLLLVSTGVPLRRLAAFAALPVALSALLAIPATLNVVTPGRPWVSLATLPEGRWWLWQLPPELAITQHGVYVAVRLVVRVLACVAAVFVLVSTTRTDRVWHGLRSLGVPRLPIMMLSMMCRYLDSLARVAAEMHLARLSRTIARLDVRSEQRWVASNLAALFRRTYALASAVHLAMCARGYTGEMLTWKSAPWRVADTCLVGAVLAACAALTRLP